MSNESGTAQAEPMPARLAEHELRRLIGQVAGAVPGVAEVPRASQIQLASGVGGLTVTCAVLAQHGVALHELGLSIQLAVAELLRRAGKRVEAVNVTIYDIE